MPTSVNVANDRKENWECGRNIPHRFHTCQGRNVRLGENRTVATRVASFSDGLVFSEKPLRPNELFLVEVERNDLGWNGSLRIGITETDPAKRDCIPRFALPDLVAEGTSWMYTLDRTEVDDELSSLLTVSESKLLKMLRNAPFGARLNFDALNPRRRRQTKNRHVSGHTNRLKYDQPIDNHSPLPEELSKAPVAEGSRVGVFYTKEGEDLAFLYFVVNGECRGPYPFELDVNQPLFAVCDIYGITKTIRIVPLYHVPTLKALCRDAILLNAYEARRCLGKTYLPPVLQRFLEFEAIHERKATQPDVLR
ncbi:hypothetical protein RvY_18343 [Ramazzottius varieornatus]|uniref:NHR domain-containing protein n=1 Tax=Ramazzottius varieornatus TaxID=947166 RepID=A0A1D1WAB3_RAMVA|nr:hypothetical protein RvY_18343 [Ramazzottius varieornatus]